jgi:PAS domain S-box-containing protein
MENNYLKNELYDLIKKDDSIFNFIQDSSLDGLWYWDLENPEEEWMNAKFWISLGYNPEEMPHKSSAWQDLINQDDLKVVTENFLKHCETPDYPFNQTVRYTHKNGSTVWIQCRGMAIRDKDGKPLRMLGAHIDITGLKQTEEKLNQTNQLFQEASKITKTGAWELDLATNLTIWTDEVYSIYEVDTDFDHNKINGISFYHPDYQQIIIDAITQSISEKISFDVEAKFIGAKGTEKWVRATGHPIIDKGEVTKLFGVFIDITATKKIQDELIFAKEQA